MPVELLKKFANSTLLDALCLDPDSERFLTERVDLLLANEAKHFTRLLMRFHHIATVPTSGGVGPSVALGLYLEANHRSIVVGRWPPVLRFLIAQRERLSGFVSPALAKLIETWLPAHRCFGQQQIDDSIKAKRHRNHPVSRRGNHLESEGVAHRDIKPENIGIAENRNKKLQLVLFDFSLCRTPADNITAGIDASESRIWTNQRRCRTAPSGG